MAQFHRIVWSEGLFITPQHFQQADLYHEAQVAERIAVTRPFPWGVHSMEIDQETLTGGSFRLLSFRGLFPSGASVRAPDFDPTPPSVDVAEAFDPRSDTLDIYLGLPLRRTGWPNTDLSEGTEEGKEEARYRAKTVQVADENTGRNERPVQKAELNLKILRENDLRDNFECLRVAQVTRSSRGEFGLVKDYVPPMLSVHASPFLLQTCRSLLERLNVRSTELSGRFTEGGTSSRDITPANLRAFLQLSVINSVVPALSHIRETEGVAPVDFYNVLAGLVGQLCTFNPAKHHPRDVPQYDHVALGPTFAALERQVVDLLEFSEIQHGYEVVPLQVSGENQYQGAFHGEGMLQPGSALILSLASEEIRDQAILESSRRVIVTSLDRLARLVALNMPGVPLRHMPVPPPAIPRRRNTYYFQLEYAGGDWEAIRESRAIAIKLPGGLAGCQIELLSLGAGR